MTGLGRDGCRAKDEGAALGFIAIELMLWVSGTMSAVVICGTAFGFR